METENQLKKVKIPEKIEEHADVQPLEKCLDRFWLSGEKLKLVNVSIVPPAVSIALLKRLGVPAIYRKEKEFLLYMERIYKFISKQAIDSACE